MNAFIRCAGCALTLLAFAHGLAGEPKPAEVMLLGVFHFANPGQDVVKADHLDVLTDENQAYLVALSERISRYRPTVVLLEFTADREPAVQEEYLRYVAGDFDLPANEIYQLGFRIAALAGAPTVFGFDETAVQWQAGPLFEYLEGSDTVTGARMSAFIEELTREEQAAQATLSLQALLRRANDADRDALNRGFYMLTNAVGNGNDFIGADATASWWHRNFRMYALVQRHALPGERVLVIGGQGHIAILRQLLADDVERRAVDVRPLL
ncbi:MAG TPA: DUF5694 domain-containing protein [Woeseiaceae bacterium]|nr:DUF5694 domain-containing protein [Woeseiaceae bacterium]